MNLTELIKISDREEQVDVLLSTFAIDLKAEHYDYVMRSIFNSYLEESKGDAYVAVKQSNQLFEAVAERNMTIGLCLMAELYDEASDVPAHDITDGIELWIDAEGNSDLLSYLTIQHENPSKMAMRKVYQDWIDHLRAKIPVE
ncbi:MAG: hypothetical protein H7Z72_18540 [Bacteroidetes bacterium]|nr:hypothetical protein [Fibrella sp.]